MEHPFTCIIAGPTKSGKTTFVKTFLESPYCNKFKSIVWCFAEEQPIYAKIKRKVLFIKGLPDFDTLKSAQGPLLLILDDLMHETKRNAHLVTLFTRGCHHWNISLIHIVQNIFYEGLRTSRINSDYIVLFKNPADQLQAQSLARQLYPGCIKYFLEAYKDATLQPHGYLFIDLTQDANDEHRLKADIFSKTPTIYVPKSINTL